MGVVSKIIFDLFILFVILIINIIIIIIIIKETLYVSDF